jgi:nucleoside-diphosphate-sugar epimerase
MSTEIDEVLVTGGTGFIGSHLVEKLIQKKVKVHVLVEDKLDNLEPVKDKISVINGDLFSDFSIFPKSIKAIYHLAAYSSPQDCIANPVIASKINIIGTQNMLELGRLLRIRKFIMASSSYVYGNVKNFPTRETELLQPTSPLGSTKASAELLIKSYFECYDIPAIVLRLFTVYGPRSKDDQFIPSLIRQILTKSAVELRDPEPTRDFIYVSDIVDAFIKALDLKVGFDIFNIGTGTETSIQEITKMLTDLSDKKNIQVVFTRESKRADELHKKSRHCADISNAKKLLGWQPRFNLKEGLAISYDWYKKRYGEKN